MTKTIIKIDGMSCSMCEAHINDTVRKAFDVKKVSSSHKTGIAEIISKEPISEDAIKAAIDPTGYTVLSFESEPYEKKGLFR